jgi:hypothetical protein
VALDACWRARKVLSNPAIDSDTYSAPLVRAPIGARHRERWAA